MSKCLILPDCHLHGDLLDAVTKLLDEHPDWQCISLGDWADDWGCSPEVYQQFFDTFVEFCRKYKNRLRLCWGNHDYGYWSYPGHHSGYSIDAEQIVRYAIRTILVFLPIQAVVKLDTTIFSHAGIAKGILLDFRQAAHKYPEQSLIDFCNSQDPTANWLGDSPLWHRPQDNYHKNTFNPQYLQVVGHTPVPTITHTKEDNILYTDTWSTDSERNPLGDKSLVVVDTKTQEWEIIPYE